MYYPNVAALPGNPCADEWFWKSPAIAGGFARGSSEWHFLKVYVQMNDVGARFRPFLRMR
jgi:hypothetical protein